MNNQTMYLLSTEQKQYLLKNLFDFGGKEPFQPSNIVCLEDVSAHNFHIIFMKQDNDAIVYILNSVNYSLTPTIYPAESTNKLIKSIAVANYTSIREHRDIIPYLDNNKFSKIKAILLNPRINLPI